MKKFFCFTFLFLMYFSVFAQKNEIDNTSDFPKLLKMRDIFHAEVQYPSGEKGEIFAWWNIIGLGVFSLNIFLRSFRKLFKNVVEPEFFIDIHRGTCFICIVPLILQIFCNIVTFDWRLLVSMIVLFIASLYSGMIDFNFLSSTEEQIFVNSKPKIYFLVLIAIFFGSQFA